MMSQTVAINLGARKAVVCEDDDVEKEGVACGKGRDAYERRKRKVNR